MKTLQVWEALPKDRHLGSDIWIMRDDICDINGNCSQDESTRTDIDDDENYTVHMQKDKGGPGFTWRIPFLTGFN